MHVRIPGDVLSVIDGLAKDAGTSRAAIIRDLLRKAIK